MSTGNKTIQSARPITARLKTEAFSIGTGTAGLFERATLARPNNEFLVR